MSQHQINIKQGSLRILRDIVSATGWAKSTDHIILGGGLASRLPELAPWLTKDATEKEMKDWLAETIPEFEVSEKERDAVKVAIRHFAEQGSIPPNVYAAELLKAFGFE